MPPAPEYHGKAFPLGTVLLEGDRPVPDETASSSPRETSIVRTQLSGYDLLLHPELNKGTAFTEEERNAFALHGLLPPHIGTLEAQRERR